MRVLLVDDDQGVHDALDRQLSELDWETLHALDPMEGIQLATRRLPGLILLDINMPKMDGLKVCRHLRENPATAHIPIIFLTVDRDPRCVARALDCGGSDYIHKPFNEVELHARLRAALRTKEMMDMLKEQARIDALTGLRNRAALDDALLAATSANQRMGQPMALLMIDVDHFKQINDRHGHGVGDDVLRRAGTIIQTCCRPYDTPCRFGGDEFAVVFGQTEGPNAEQAARRLLAKLSELSVASDDSEVKITFSAGLVCTAATDDELQPADWLKAADAALYQAKRDGRDQLVISGAASS